jgi:hypothetical protein
MYGILQPNERSSPAASLATHPWDYCCSFLTCPLFPPLNPVILWRQPCRRAHARVRCQDVKGCVNPLDAISHTTAGRWRGQRAKINVNPASRHIHENLADCTKWKSSLSARTQIGAYTPGMPFGFTKKVVPSPSLARTGPSSIQDRLLLLLLLLF